MSLFKSLDVTTNETKDIPKPPSFTTVEYSVKAFMDKLNDGMPDEELTDIIVRQHEMLLDYNLFRATSDTRNAARQMFMNERFLRSLIKCIRDGWITIKEHEVICCNKMAYDYIAVSDEPKDSNIRDLLIELSYSINIKTISILSAKIPQEAAQSITMMYRSSFKENVSIYRLNTYLIRCGLDLNAETIVFIYSKLFHKMTNMFCETMLEMPESFYTESNLRVYNEISIALICMLDTMPSVNIMKTLREYSFTYSMKGEPPVRFSFNGNIVDGFTRIRSCIETLKDDEGIIVP